ncbi:MAG: ATP-dependent zinc metalloprotease FtsH [Lentisphaeria bacterium]|jgi:cell division protease FtsH
MTEPTPETRNERPEANPAAPPPPEGAAGKPAAPPLPPERRFPRPPIQTFLFWILLLLLLPLGLMIFNPRSGRARLHELQQSEFEQLLRDGQVLTATVSPREAADVKKITGTYRIEKPDPGEAAARAPATVERFETLAVYTDELDKLLREHCPTRKTEASSTFWTSVVLTLLPVLLLVGVIYFLFSRQLKMAGKGALQFGKSRARLIMPNQEKVTFADVSGIEEAKEEVAEVIDFLRAPQKFQKLGGHIPKGVLMVGPPGTGKTLLARAIAGEAEVPFFHISGSDFMEMFVGVGASRVRDMFEEGKRHAPCIIFIDEIDAVGRSRFTGIGGGHDEREQTLNALLVEMDGFEPNAGVIVVAATNRPDVLDPALLRPGRFDRQITIDLPDVNGRLSILKVHVKKVTIDPHADLGVIARGTPGFSGADLANLINEAALIAAHSNKSAVDMDALEEARDKVRWGKERRSRKIDEHDREVTAYHEAGHALVGLLCEHATPLHKVTIIPRGTAYLGATMHLPESDRYTVSKPELLDQMAMLMGGRAAELLIFNETTSGAAMDIRQATDTAKKMVCQWGMSEKMGPISYSGREEHIFLGRDITRSEDYSEETAREIDNEIRRFVGDSEGRADRLLRENLERLKKLGKSLLERETMNAVEIRELLGFPPPPVKAEPGVAGPPPPAPGAEGAATPPPVPA